MRMLPGVRSLFFSRFGHVVHARPTDVGSR
jgi:hypothetical protein